MIRHECVVCLSKSLKNIHIEENTPISIGCSTKTIEHDIHTDIRYVLCISCGTAQIATPVNYEVLYNESHNNTYNTPTWSAHHKEFCSFIYESARSKSFLEIGGSTGVLAKQILEKDPSVNYTILDLCNTNPYIDGVPFINANCEEYTYSNIKCILMSHVFEHLYNPLQFLEKISNAGVSEVFLSIPNMEISLNRESLSFLHVEHTFYIDTEHLYSMFSKYKYKCAHTHFFKDHSIFFHFIFSDNEPPFVLHPESIKQLQTKFALYFSNRKSIFNTISIQNPFFIVPSGHFGQFIYKSLSHFKDKMIGFLDNDQSKIGKRLYGTHLTVFPMKEVQTYKGPLSIVLHAGPYTAEIINQLLGFNSTLEIHTIDLANNLN